MDWHETYKASYYPAMRFGGPAQVELLLRAGRQRKLGKSEVDADNRQDLSASSVLRIAAYDRRIDRARLAGQREADCAVDAADGIAGGSARTPYQSASSATSDLSVFAPRNGDSCSECGVVRGYYVYSDAVRLPLSDGGDGLVQPVCSGLGAVEFLGDGLLPAGSGKGVANGQTGHFQYRSGSTVHERGIHRQVDNGRHSDQHGRPGTRPGQSVRGTALAFGQVRGGLSPRLCRRSGSPAKSWSVFPVLQYRETTSRTGTTHSGERLFLPELMAANGGAPAPFSPQGGGEGRARKNIKRKEIDTCNSSP